MRRIYTVHDSDLNFKEWTSSIDKSYAMEPKEWIRWLEQNWTWLYDVLKHTVEVVKSKYTDYKNTVLYIGYNEFLIYKNDDGKWYYNFNSSKGYDTLEEVVAKSMQNDDWYTNVDNTPATVKSTLPPLRVVSRKEAAEDAWEDGYDYSGFYDGVVDFDESRDLIAHAVKNILEGKDIRKTLTRASSRKKKI